MRRFRLGMSGIAIVGLVSFATSAHAQVGYLTGGPGKGAVKGQQTARTNAANTGNSGGGMMGHCMMMNGGGMAGMMGNGGMQNPMMGNGGAANSFAGGGGGAGASGLGFAMPYGGGNMMGMQQPMSYDQMAMMQQQMMLYQMMLMQQYYLMSMMQNNPYMQGLNNPYMQGLNNTNNTNSAALGLQRQRNATTSSNQAATQTTAFRSSAALRR